MVSDREGTAKCICGGLSVTVVGAREGMPTRDAIDAATR